MQGRNICTLLNACTTRNIAIQMLTISFIISIGDLSQFWLSCLDPLIFLPPPPPQTKTHFKINIWLFNLLTERNWWQSFQKRVLRTNLIHVSNVLFLYKHENKCTILTVHNISILWISDERPGLLNELGDWIT